MANKQPLTAEQIVAAHAEGLKPAPAVALRYTGAGAQVPNAPTRDLTAEETPQYLTKAGYHAGLDAGIYARADEPKAHPAPKAKAKAAPKAKPAGSPPPPAAPAEQEPTP